MDFYRLHLGYNFFKQWDNKVKITFFTQPIKKVAYKMKSCVYSQKNTMIISSRFKKMETFGAFKMTHQQKSGEIIFSFHIRFSKNIHKL